MLFTMSILVAAVRTRVLYSLSRAWAGKEWMEAVAYATRSICDGRDRSEGLYVSIWRVLEEETRIRARRSRELPAQPPEELLSWHAPMQEQEQD